MLWVVLGGLLAAGTVGCGNKGPLVLPAKPSAAVVGDQGGPLADGSDPVDDTAAGDVDDADANADPLHDEPVPQQPGV
jgi:predicted small lipoprotein YifL